MMVILNKATKPCLYYFLKIYLCYLFVTCFFFLKKNQTNHFLVYFCYLFTYSNLQIGNAVPPPMGRAIGLEIKKCLVWKQKDDELNGKTQKDENAEILASTEGTNSADVSNVKEKKAGADENSRHKKKTIPTSADRLAGGSSSKA